MQQPAEARAGVGGTPQQVNDGAIAVFEFTGKNGDNNGYILARHGGEVKEV